MGNDCDLHGVDIAQELSCEGSQPHIVTRLVERAEAAEVQLAQAQQELRAVRHTATARAAAEGAGTSAAMSAAQVLYAWTGNSDPCAAVFTGHSCLLTSQEDPLCHSICVETSSLNVTNMNKTQRRFDNPTAGVPMMYAQLL